MAETIHTVQAAMARVAVAMSLLYDEFARTADVADEPQRMLFLELENQARTLASRMDEASRILANFHGPRDAFLSPSFAERVMELRRQSASQRLAGRDFENFADRIVS